MLIFENEKLDTNNHGKRQLCYGPLYSTADYSLASQMKVGLHV